MSQDITSLLEDWPFDPESVNVRKITDADGTAKIQLRLDLGLLQMEVDGRPDGQQVRGVASWLDFYRNEQKQHEDDHPDGTPYLLDSEDCALLLREGVQYYHRYISFWHLGMYEHCARDTRRNLKLFEFVRTHARNEPDKLQFDQWRPYVTMMHARAVATPLVELNQVEAAIGSIESGIRDIEAFLEDYDQTERAEQLSELVFLKRWRRQLVRKLGKENDIESDEPDEADPIEQLREQLESAVAEERYEEAATLRDELRRIEEPPPPEPLGG